MKRIVFEAEVARVRLEEYKLADGRSRVVVTLGQVKPRRRKR